VEKGGKITNIAEKRVFRQLPILIKSIFKCQKLFVWGWKTKEILVSGSGFVQSDKPKHAWFIWRVQSDGESERKQKEN
jgi:hypothetical protein